MNWRCQFGFHSWVYTGRKLRLASPIHNWDPYSLISPFIDCPSYICTNCKKVTHQYIRGVYFPDVLYDLVLAEKLSGEDTKNFVTRENTIPIPEYQ